MSLLDRVFGRTPPEWDDRATLEDVYYAYRLILQRPPDLAGLTHYQQLVTEGLSLDRLVRTFLDSDERRADLQPTPVDLGGYKVCVQKLDTDFAPAILATHDYEPHVRQAVRELLRDGDVVVDVGANVGCIAFLAATLVGEHGLVVAVEPNPNNHQLLCAGVLLNGFRNVRVFPFAASNRHELFSLTGGISNTHVAAARAPGDGTVYTQAAVLDELLGWLPRLDLVKMDVEGHEPQALEGFKSLVERHRPALVIEFNPRCLTDLQERDPMAYLAQIFALYARVRAISHWGDDDTFERPSDLMEYWRRRNREVTNAGLLPDRLLHFDLIAERG